MKLTILTAMIALIIVAALGHWLSGAIAAAITQGVR